MKIIVGKDKQAEGEDDEYFEVEFVVEFVDYWLQGNGYDGQKQDHSYLDISLKGFAFVHDSSYPVVYLCELQENNKK